MCLKIKRLSTPAERHLEICKMVKEIVAFMIIEKELDISKNEIDFFTNLLALELKDLFDNSIFYDFNQVKK